MQFENFVAMWAQNIKLAKSDALYDEAVPCNWKALQPYGKKQIHRTEQSIFMMSMYHAIWKLCSHMAATNNQKKTKIHFMRMVYHAIWKLCSHMSQKYIEQGDAILWWRCIVQFESCVATWLTKVNWKGRYICMMSKHHAFWKLCSHMATKK